MDKASTVSISAARVLMLLVILVVLIVLSVFFPAALPVILKECTFTAILLLAAAGLGMTIMRIIRLPIQRFDELVLATVFGTGSLSLLVFVLGSAGLIERWFWMAIIAVLMVAAVFWLIRTRPEIRAPSPWWLLAAPFLLPAVLAACAPPGILWPDEGFGYDVLEYHLAAPKEYHANGRVSFLPHNIYANMPFAAEMLYLLAMILRGGSRHALFAAQFIHVGMAILAVLATAAAARPFGRFAAVVAGIAVAACPVLSYFAGVAYVEGGMLAMTAGSMACLVRMYTNSDGRLRWGVMAGLLAGMACGFKYTAIPMIAMPICLSMLLMPRHTWGERLKLAGVVTLFAVAAFCPWPVRNYLASGNPFFPLARGVFLERPGIWTDELAVNWHNAHLPNPANRSIVERLRALREQVAFSPWYGSLPLLAAAALVILATGRRRKEEDDSYRDAAFFMVRVCVLLILSTIVVWLTATHLVARFAMPIIPAAALLIALAAVRLRQGAGRLVVVPALAASWMASIACGLTVVNPLVLLACSDVMGDRDIVRGPFPVYAYLPQLNEMLASGKRVLIVAEARTLYLEALPEQYDYRVVFNRSPFAEAAARLKPQELIDWLVQQRFDLVLVNWSEMHRLQRTYGFYPSVNDQLFIDLVAAGLQPIEHFRMSEESQAPFATIFAVTTRPSGI